MVLLVPIGGFLQVSLQPIYIYICTYIYTLYIHNYVILYIYINNDLYMYICTQTIYTYICILGRSDWQSIALRRQTYTFFGEVSTFMKSAVAQVAYNFYILGLPYHLPDPVLHLQAEQPCRALFEAASGGDSIFWWV